MWVPRASAARDVDTHRPTCPSSTSFFHRYTHRNLCVGNTSTAHAAASRPAHITKFVADVARCLTNVVVQYAALRTYRAPIACLRAADVV